ncbi:aminomethyl-transferring glycine dehydrogenase [Aestuariivirga sp.]|uniref:aminomethyl-transferring glycine dehydrogenase n=1 Tax=Aestuariivirga sp. TaxID=2650926 RepID=UPI0039E4F095
MDKRIALKDLEPGANFIRRHIGPDEAETAAMLKTVGASTLDDFIDKVVPRKIRAKRPLDLAKPMPERTALSYLREAASRNEVFTSMIGMGYYGTITPKVILRNILENPGWYTAYTPYQAEVSQGRLEALLNYQQMIVDMTGLPIANASLLDEGTAAAEAMTMAKRVAKSPSTAFFVDADTHPQTIGVMETRAKGFGYTLVIGDPLKDLRAAEVFGALLSYPGSSGEVRDFTGVISALHGAGALAIVTTDLLALALLKTPSEMGADIAIGSSQRFGVPMGFGGPHAAFFATRDEYKRTMPGRLIGVSVDAKGNRALRMALQTREQHIRREKATSNICTAQVLLAVIASMFAVYNGPKGIRKTAERTHRFAEVFAAAVTSWGFEVATKSYFDTVTLHVPGRAHMLWAKAKEKRINLRFVDANHLGISFDQTTRRQELMKLLSVFKSDAERVIDVDAIDSKIGEVIPPALQRKSTFLTHPVFSMYHSETEMLRYLRHLQCKDLALDQAMIPLGSCTMKLNATSEMIPVTWREFAMLHPFAPLEQTQGYQQLFEELEEMLAEITGFDAISLQPNAGSQGEYAGLLAIKRYHESWGNHERDICLIPVSAHGTNPASAAMAGLQIVAVACDAQGNVDVKDLEAKAQQYSSRLAALMITYPSTHGVFEEAIIDICAIIHAHGGQVYLDGANLNAQVGLMRPAELGADVCHMNLHKTFCIPHGGGGPGMGPIGVKAHLAPFLPGHTVVDGVNPAAGKEGHLGAVSSGPWGSASILPISWMYIAMMGGEGLAKATAMAILNANYIAARLKPHFPVLYTGPGGFVAHECILDLRDLKERTGLSVEDVAKRLVDYGFHAPTMSFPVVDTLMIEPTESEGKRELDRFCDAMIAIAGEIAAVEKGKADRVDNVLKNAPHTHAELFGEWTHPYSKEQAFFPLRQYPNDKYWPPVARVDNVHGDRNLVCICPPMSEYLEAAE